MKISLPAKAKPYIQALSRSSTALVGLALIVIFGYTALIVNAATNTKSDGTSPPSEAKIVFDKSALKAVKARNQVPDQTSLGNLGKTDPFAH